MYDVPDWCDQRFYCANCLTQGDFVELWEGDTCDRCRVKFKLLRALHRRERNSRRILKQQCHLRVKEYLTRRKATA